MSYIESWMKLRVAANLAIGIRNKPFGSWLLMAISRKYWDPGWWPAIGRI